MNFLNTRVCKKKTKQKKKTGRSIKIVITFFNWSKSQQFLQMQIKIYICELLIISVTVYVDRLLQLSVEV